MIGVIAAANSVPGRQSSGMMKAAAALAAPAIMSVWRERPDWVRVSRTPLHASEIGFQGDRYFSCRRESSVKTRCSRRGRSAPVAVRTAWPLARAFSEMPSRTIASGS